MTDLSLNLLHDDTDVDSGTACSTIGAEALRLARMQDNIKGKKFEELLLHTIPTIPDLEINQCWIWKNLPGQIRDKVFPGTTRQDTGVDLVAQRNDGTYVAI